MVYFFALVALLLVAKDLCNEFRAGGSLYIDLRPARRHLAELDELELPYDWQRDDVVRTLAEIEAL